MDVHCDDQYLCKISRSHAAMLKALKEMLKGDPWGNPIAGDYRQMMQDAVDQAEAELNER